jgi:hypothetical protein
MIKVKNSAYTRLHNPVAEMVKTVWMRKMDRVLEKLYQTDEMGSD